MPSRPCFPCTSRPRRLGILGAIGLSALLVFCTLALRAGGAGRGEIKVESFDTDSRWQGVNNRSAREHEPATIRQDFGYSLSAKAGGRRGEAGGTVVPAGEAAYYGKVLAPRTLAAPLSASGTLSCADGGGHLLLGFFNSATVNEWRTPNTIALRVNYPVCRARGAGGRHGQSRECPRIVPDGASHDWSLDYDPDGAGGKGRITVTLDGKRCTLDLEPGARSSGTLFDRFGIVTTWIDGNSQDVYWDDLVYTVRH